MTADQTPADGLYPMRVATRMTGLTPHTIRVWERPDGMDCTTTYRIDRGRVTVDDFREAPSPAPFRGEAYDGGKALVRSTAPFAVWTKLDRGEMNPLQLRGVIEKKPPALLGLNGCLKPVESVPTFADYIDRPSGLEARLAAAEADFEGRGQIGRDLSSAAVHCAVRHGDFDTRTELEGAQAPLAELMWVEPEVPCERSQFVQGRYAVGEGAAGSFEKGVFIGGDFMGVGRTSKEPGKTTENVPIVG